MAPILPRPGSARGLARPAAGPGLPGFLGPVYYRGEVTIAVCPGSFDPLTLGHLDIVRRARSLFDEVVLGVARNSSKSALLSAEQRVEIARAALDASPGLEDVRVAIVPGLLVDFCREVGAVAVVKGLRGGADFDAELPMALMNRHLVGVETVFVPGDPALAHVASSLVKDVARFGGPVDDLVPAGVGDLVRRALADRAAGSTPATEQSRQARQATPTTEGTGR